MASGVVSFMGVTGTLNAYPTYIIAYLSLTYCLSPANSSSFVKLRLTCLELMPMASAIS